MIGGAPAPCARECVLADGPAALAAARAFPDSLDTPLELARATVSGAPGDTVAVVFSADSAVLAAVPLEELLVVNDGASGRSLRLRDVVGGAVVYEFVRSDTVVLSYSLNRRIAADVNGAARLTQITSATVLALKAPWATAAGLFTDRHTSLVRLADATTCSESFDVPGPGDYCGTSIGFSASGPAVAFLSLGAEFQNAVNTGPSAPITITFTPAVREVTVTAYDPTFDGNTVQAFDGDTPIGIASFPGNQEPGTTTVQTRSLTGRISRIVLTPAEADYVAYSMQVTVGAPAVTLVCGDGTVTRGESIECRVDVQPPDPSVAVTGWYFVPDDQSLADRIDRQDGAETSVTWDGIMAASGTMHAAWRSGNGPEQDAMAHVTVKARDWKGKTVDFPAVRSSDDADMSNQPYRVSDEGGLYHLGHTHMSAGTLDTQGKLGVIPTGPNSGFFYLTAIPVSPEWSIHVNYDQLKTNSALAQLQNEEHKAFEATPMCTRADLPRLVPLIERHEGVGLDPKSHLARFKAKFNQVVGPTFESVVWGRKDTDIDTRAKAAAETVQKAAAEESKKADEDFKAPFPCQITLFPAPK